MGTTYHSLRAIVQVLSYETEVPAHQKGIEPSALRSTGGRSNQ